MNFAFYFYKFQFKEKEGGFLLLKNGKTEIGKAIDEEGRLIPETSAEIPKEAPKKKTKKK